MFRFIVRYKQDIVAIYWNWSDDWCSPASISANRNDVWTSKQVAPHFSLRCRSVYVFHCFIGFCVYIQVKNTPTGIKRTLRILNSLTNTRSLVPRQTETRLWKKLMRCVRFIRKNCRKCKISEKSGANPVTNPNHTTSSMAKAILESISRALDNEIWKNIVAIYRSV